MGTETSIEARWLSPAALVVVRGTHTCIVGTEDRPDIPLDLPALRFLGRAAAGIPAHPGLSAADAHVANQLEARGLLLTDPPSRRAPIGSPDRHLESDPVADPDDILILAVPMVFAVFPDRFEHQTVLGQVISLGPLELSAIAEFRRPKSMHEAHEDHRRIAGDSGLGEQEFMALVTRLNHAGLLAPYGTDTPDARENAEARAIWGFIQSMSSSVAEAVREHEETERNRGGEPRVPIVPIDQRANPTPLGMGMVVAHALAEGPSITDHYRLVPRWMVLPDALVSIPTTPSVFLFSNYIWSHGQNLNASKVLKERSPCSITVHGGPDTPKYQGDVEAYFRANPHVDVAVHGEGEVTTTEMLQALVGCLGDHPPDLSSLHDVAGLSFRDGDRIVTTAARDRIQDLNTIPSPFLMGIFDSHARAGGSFAILETNRGCPYGCTFCDWGSATASRIRKFDLDRIFAELDWCAAHEIEQVFLADANFGIFERDVEIAEKVAGLRQSHGFPRLFSTNYAKNTTKHLKRIVQTLCDGNILTQGLLSLQSMDEGTLGAVRRSNIKLEKYEDLAREFRSAGLPLFVDLMIGLPGATPRSFRDDLQGCVDREVTAKIYPTELLVNSPMNAPEYKSEHLIQTSAPLGSLVTTDRRPDGSTRRALVVSTSTFTREDYAEMVRMRRAYIVAENLGVLRQIARYVRQERGLGEVDFYDQLRVSARTRPEQWPSVSFSLEAIPFVGAPPVSWDLLYDEIHEYLVDVLAVPDDAALDSVLRVQKALVPARGRRFPEHLLLAHDFAAWHRAVLEAKDTGDYDWTRRVPALREFPPGSFEVDDPNDVCGRGVGFAIDENAHAAWELSSSVARAVSNEHLVAS